MSRAEPTPPAARPARAAPARLACGPARRWYAPPMRPRPRPLAAAEACPSIRGASLQPGVLTAPAEGGIAAWRGRQLRELRVTANSERISQVHRRQRGQRYASLGRRLDLAGVPMVFGLGSRPPTAARSKFLCPSPSCCSGSLGQWYCGSVITGRDDAVRSSQAPRSHPCLPSVRGFQIAGEYTRIVGAAGGVAPSSRLGRWCVVGERSLLARTGVRSRCARGATAAGARRTRCNHGRDPGAWARAAGCGAAAVQLCEAEAAKADESA